MCQYGIAAATFLPLILRLVRAPVVPEEQLATLTVELASGTAFVGGKHGERLQAVLRHHWQSKHFFDEQAELPSKFMDWEMQPSPWRSYTGSPAIELSRQRGGLPSLRSFQWGPPSSRRNDGSVFAAAPAEVSVAPLNLDSISSFLHLAGGISAWKSYDGIHKWPLRVAPSSGNLQTTELYVVMPGGVLSSVAHAGGPAVYHYHPARHVLELRLAAPLELVTSVGGPAGDVTVGFLLIFTTLCVREAWKYGDRALRSCHLNIGHAVAAALTSAEVHGWSVEAAPPALSAQESLGSVLGIKVPSREDDNAEREVPELALLVRTQPGSVGRPAADAIAANTLVSLYQSSPPHTLGSPAPLSAAAASSVMPPGVGSFSYQRWPAMDAAQDAAMLFVDDFVHSHGDGAFGARDISPAIASTLLDKLWFANGSTPQEIILGRRSALKMARSGRPLPVAAFASTLRALCGCWSFPSVTSPPRLYGTAGGVPGVHALFMVHNVEGLPPGLYLLARGAESAEQLLRRFARGNNFINLRHAVRGDSSTFFARELSDLQTKGCEVFVISAPTDVRQASQLAACNQEIAGDGAFSVALLGRFDGWGHPHRYLEVLWEAGALGHALYLVATAAGAGVTGIGCFFDDFTLSLLRDPGGIDAGSSRAQTLEHEGARFQALYHATVGWAVPDPRLLSFDGNHHLDEEHSYEPLQGGIGRIYRKM
eukprot:TRINITY_DN40910_c0_g1_i1.p1 TRINITY_DN40910_c0_g1~~TRINITY_DN40910_c0_g1_i1.p1  ORF type:complete len:709 (-),score=106.24 TRINITY_DN40910_c0_g1_i1:132-2258(-)